MMLNTGLIITLMVSSVTFSTTSFATETDVPLFTATSDAFDGTLLMRGKVDEAFQMTKLVYTAKNVDHLFELSSLPQGIVIYQSGNKNVVTITSPDFDSNQGGVLTLTYLHDGITGKYLSDEYEMTRIGQTWKLSVNDNAGRRDFTEMFFKANKFLGKTIGIDTISVK